MTIEWENTGMVSMGMGALTRSLAVLMLVASTLTIPLGAGAQTNDTDNRSAMCAPVTLSDLFPEPDEPATSIAIGGRNATPLAPISPPVTTPAPAPNCRPFVYEMGSPVGHVPGVISEFGADRPNGRKHKGADIDGDKLTPVYAVSDGVVSYFGGECCSLAIRHTDGWTSYYIHLNNDTAWSDDGQGWGIAPDLSLGTSVVQGQLLGWIGDSGNAETTVPHLHFELRMPDGTAIDAVPSLRSSAAITTAIALGSPAGASTVIEFDTTARFRAPFSDDDGTHYEAAIGQLTALGLITGCGVPLGSAFCPDSPIYGPDVEAFIRTAFGIELVASDILTYGPPTTDRSLAAIVSVFDCGVGRYCDTQPLTAGEVAQIFGAIGPAEPIRTGPNVISLAACDLPLSNPEQVLTRAAFAAAAADLLGMATQLECGAAD